MPPPNPRVHPVTEILHNILNQATMPQIVDLSNLSDEEPTNTNQQGSADNEEDSDDDIQIVSAEIVAPPSHLIHLQQMADQEKERNAYPTLVDRDPHPPSVNTADCDGDVLFSPSDQAQLETNFDVIGASGDDDDEVIECVSPQKRTRVSTKCSACDKRLGTNEGVTMGRCKHTLCTSCALACVTKTVSNLGLMELPVCAVEKCKAPLGIREVDEALAAETADQAFAPELERFREWRKPVMENDGEATDIYFPGVMMEYSALALDGGGFEGLDNLLIDDITAACEPLWMYRAHDEVKGWVCLACGCLDLNTAAHQVDEKGSKNGGNDKASDAEGTDDVIVVDDDEIEIVPVQPVQDEVQATKMKDYTDLAPPSYPHCAFARALGIYENIMGLSQVWESEDSGKRKKRKEQQEKYKAPHGTQLDLHPPPFESGMENLFPTAKKKRYRSATSIRRHYKRRKAPGFAKGTGYAGANGIEWQGISAEKLEATKKLDAEATYWLMRIRCYLLRSESDVQVASWPVYMRSLLRHCKLVEHLAKILINESIMDVLARIPIFYAALKVVHALAELSSLRVLVTEPSDGDEGRSLAELVESISRQAAVLSSGAGSDELPSSTQFLIKQIRKTIRVINRHQLLQAAKNRAIAPMTIDDDPGEGGEEKTAAAVSNDTTQVGPGDKQEKDDDVSFETDAKAYIEKMKQHQFQAVPGLAQTSIFWHEAMQGGSQMMNQGKRLRRINTEVASLCSSLPLSWSSTILLRVDEDRYDFLRACIFGPEGTPYDSGAFLFDIFLPPNYPQAPPKFTLLTTGAGKVRFNPNLYSNGKVCLSLLGTWSGPSWTPASTILQVLVSIQSLILVPDPYFNEPGYESTVGTIMGKRESTKYNARVRVDNALYAIQYNIRHPGPEFASGLAAHYRLKGRYVAHTLKTWFASSETTGNLGESAGGESNQMVSNGQSVGTGVPAPPTANGAGGLASSAMSSAGLGPMLSAGNGNTTLQAYHHVSNGTNFLEMINSLTNGMGVSNPILGTPSGMGAPQTSQAASNQVTTTSSGWPAVFPSNVSAVFAAMNQGHAALSHASPMGLNGVFPDMRQNRPPRISPSVLESILDDLKSVAQ